MDTGGAMSFAIVGVGGGPLPVEIQQANFQFSRGIAFSSFLVQ